MGRPRNQPIREASTTKRVIGARLRMQIKQNAGRVIAIDIEASSCNEASA